MSFNGVHPNNDFNNLHFKNSGQARHSGHAPAHKCCPQHHGGQPAFGAAISTTNVQNTVHQCQCKIDYALGSHNINIANTLREITQLLEGLMGQLGGQAGSKGSCSAAGQMTTQMQTLYQATPVNHNQAQYLNPHIQHTLNEISVLLAQLAGTMHTNFKAQTAFQRHR